MSVLPSGIQLGAAALAGLLLAGIVIHTRERRLRRHYQHQAGHDDLTGLPNRRALRTAALAARRRQRPYGLVVLDLDHFKAINDTHGHPGGNTVLAAVGARLTALARDTVLPGSTAAVTALRLSGDEFALLVPGDRDQVRAAAIAATRAIAAAPITIGGTAVTVTATAGYAHAALGTTDELLLSLADEALYTAKYAGRGTVAGAPSTIPHTTAGGPRPRDQREHN